MALSKMSLNATRRVEMGTQNMPEEIPVDLASQKDQREVGVDDGCEFDLEHVALEVGVAAGTGLHQFAGFLRDSNCFPANHSTHSPSFCTDFKGFFAFFRADPLIYLRSYYL